MRRSRNLLIPGLIVLGLLGLSSTWVSARSALAEKRAGEGVAWREDIAAAARESLKTGKPVFLNFTAHWCPPCRRMESETWRDPEVQSMLESAFIPVKVDIDRHPEIAQAHAVSSIPTLVVYKGRKPADQAAGFHGPHKLLEFLKPHTAGHHDAAVAP